MEFDASFNTWLETMRMYCETDDLQSRPSGLVVRLRATFIELLILDRLRELSRTLINVDLANNFGSVWIYLNDLVRRLNIGCSISEGFRGPMYQRSSGAHGSKAGKIRSVLIRDADTGN